MIWEPFPHTVVDGMWDDGLLKEVAAEFPDPDDNGWRRYDKDKERKFEGPERMWGEATHAFFGQLGDRAAEIGNLFGYPDATMEVVGGGYHLIPPGGYLGVHTDFNRSARTQRYRVVNILVYLNHDWTDEGGRLELWDDTECRAEIAPEFNRTVMFATSSESWHGHPKPAERWRKSVAAYLFSATKPKGYTSDQSTVFHASRRA